MSLWTLIRRSLLYYWRTNLAVAAGVAVAVAVVVGSLVIGDSVDGSLHHAALKRLGKIEFALQRDRFFRDDLVTDNDVVPAIIVQGSARLAEGRTYVPDVTLIGVDDDRFWSLFEHPPQETPQGSRVVLSRSLAEDLDVREGDDLIVAAGTSAAIPVDTIFARTAKGDTLKPIGRLTVASVLDEESAGAFSLKTDRVRPRNLFVSLSWLRAEKHLDQKDRINALLLPTGSGKDATALQEELARVMTPADYDLEVRRTPKLHLLTAVTTNVVMPTDVAAAVMHAARENSLKASPTSVFLANRMDKVNPSAGDDGIPYAIIGVLDEAMVDVLGPPFSADDLPGDEQIVLNDWVLDNGLSAKPGDRVRLTYYRSDKDGQLRDDNTTCTVKGTLPEETCGLLKDAVPTYKGLTDAASMRELKLPFPLTERIRPADDRFWRRWKTAPKAFVSPATMRSFWMPEDPALREFARWITAFRMHLPAKTDLESAAARFEASLLKKLEPAQVGLVWRPVRAEALAASKGTQNFAMLFLSMSFFLVAAAAGLIVLLMRLNVERRASQIGILMATGFDRKRAGRSVVGEGLLVAVVGMVVGTPLGVLYAQGILWALRTNWAGAVAEFPMRLYVTPLSVAIGAVSGLAVAAFSVAVSTRILRKVHALVLLGGWRAVAAEPHTSARRPAAIIAAIGLTTAATLLILWAAFHAVPATAAFAGSGTGLLVGSLALFCVVLLRPEKPRTARSHLSLGTLALRGASRHWLRSLLTAGLLACASLLIVTVAAFRQDLSRLDPDNRDGGAGGFELVATSDVPIYRDIGTPAGRRALNFKTKDSQELNDVRILSFSRTRGDDISCLNLQKTPAPRVLGVPASLITRGGFAFASHVRFPENSNETNPWRLLQRKEDDDTISCFGDAATLQWQLKKGLGDVIEVPTPDGGTARLRLVGTLSGSIFAGDLLVSQENFRRVFGTNTGYRYFLVSVPPGRADAAARLLRDNLGQMGLQVKRSVEVLAEFAQVQNTYLSAFQTLGGLGLVLGTFGVVVVLLRNVVERRGELAMLLALGFTRGRLAGMVLLENALLLLLGVVVGAVSALVAAGPQLASATSDINWPSLATMLGITVLVGLGGCAVASFASVRRGLIDALRSE